MSALHLCIYIANATEDVLINVACVLVNKYYISYISTDTVMHCMELGLKFNTKR